MNNRLPTFLKKLGSERILLLGVISDKSSQLACQRCRISLGQGLLYLNLPSTEAWGVRGGALASFIYSLSYSCLWDLKRYFYQHTCLLHPYRNQVYAYYWLLSWWSSFHFSHPSLQCNARSRRWIPSQWSLMKTGTRNSLPLALLSMAVQTPNWSIGISWNAGWSNNRLWTRQRRSGSQARRLTLLRRQRI